jgi:Fe-S-cluster containining protein
MRKSRKRDGASRRKDRSERTNSLCADCPAKCCHKLLIPFNKPKDDGEIDYYRWHVQYDTVSIAIRSHRWYVVVDGRCMYLDDDNLCTIYDDRPDTCRDHNPPDCEHYGDWYDELIETPEELDAWFEKERKRRARRRRKARRRRRAAKG